MYLGRELRLSELAAGEASSSDGKNLKCSPRTCAKPEEVIRILLLRVLYYGPLFSETPISTTVGTRIASSESPSLFRGSHAQKAQPHRRQH